METIIVKEINFRNCELYEILVTCGNGISGETRTPEVDDLKKRILITVTSLTTPTSFTDVRGRITGLHQKGFLCFLLISCFSVG